VISDGKGIAIQAACSGANGASGRRWVGRLGQPAPIGNLAKAGGDRDLIRNGNREANTWLRSAAERLADRPCQLGAVYTRRRCRLGGIVASVVKRPLLPTVGMPREQ
jgi:hypothetical protein